MVIRESVDVILHYCSPPVFHNLHCLSKSDRLLDNTVRYEGRCLQIPPNRNRHNFAKSTIRVLEYWNGAIALFHGPREIARFHSDGTPNEKAKAKKEFAA